MNGELREIPPEEYAKQVLPLTAKLWANRRSFTAYVSQTLELARSDYGKRHYRTLGLHINGKIVSSFKRYERRAVLRAGRLAAIGIGAVFTPEDERGCGFASAMLAMALDSARRSGFDFAYLFSDIHPQFYKELGFAELPSRALTIRSTALPASRIRTETLSVRNYPSIQRCFTQTAKRRDWGFERGPLIRKWTQMRLAHGSEHAQGQAVHLLARRGKTIAAYVLGQREPAKDVFVLDEFGFAAESDGELIGPLLRAAAGDLRKIAGWLPPEGAREALPGGSIHRRKDSIFMIAPLGRRGTAYLERAKNSGKADGVWATDHI